MEAKSRPKFPAATHTDTTIIEHPVRPHPLVIIFDTITMPIEISNRVLTRLIAMLTGSYFKVLINEKQFHTTFRLYTLEEGYKTETLCGAVFLSLKLWNIL